jgi:hypothetical protein
VCALRLCGVPPPVGAHPADRFRDVGVGPTDAVLDLRPLSAPAVPPRRRSPWAAPPALQLVTRAQHPSAAATAMLTTRGGLRPGRHAVLVIAAGVGLGAALGEAARLRHPDRSGTA